MKKTFLSSLIIAACAATALFSCDNGEKKTVTETTISNDSLAKRGEYLVSVMGCDDCHSPKKLGPHGPEIIPELRFSGYPAGRPMGKADSTVVKNGFVLFAGDLTAAVGPWGISYAANITPDSTGIGVWTEEQFKKAITEGKSKGLDNSRPLLPPMPWTNFKNLTDTDVKAIFLYLKSIKPVKNVVPPPGKLSDL